MQACLFGNFLPLDRQFLIITLRFPSDSSLWDIQIFPLRFMSLFALYPNLHFPIAHLLDFTLVLLFQLASTNSVLIEPVCFFTRWKCARLTYHPDILLQTELQLIPFYANFRSLAAPKIFRRLPGPSICFRGNWQNQTEFNFCVFCQNYFGEHFCSINLIFMCQKIGKSWTLKVLKIIVYCQAPFHYDMPCRRIY